MDKLMQFIEQLRRVAKVLEPYIRESIYNKNGKKYISNSKFLPRALMW